MATHIIDVSNYCFRDGCLVLKKDILRIVSRVLMAAFAIVFLVIPNPIQSSFQAFTPIQVIEEQRSNKLADYIRTLNKTLSKEEAIALIDSVKRWSKSHRLDPALLMGLIETESTFNPHAISPAGAFGFMQVLPKWHLDKIIEAREVIGTPELFNPETNVFLGSWILKDCMTKYKVLDKSLKCYNGSVGMETNYAQKVMSARNKYSSFEALQEL